VNAGFQLPAQSGKAYRNNTSRNELAYVNILRREKEERKEKQDGFVYVGREQRNWTKAWIHGCGPFDYFLHTHTPLI
jgi:hypothetical protein